MCFADTLNKHNQAATDSVAALIRTFVLVGLELFLNWRNIKFFPPIDELTTKSVVDRPLWR
ncbi:hypothetical protein CBI33_06690 [Rhodococcus erythropolis]|nr:hypothetical protein CBI33_06690 [Rhodococcus erythropolis]